MEDVDSEEASEAIEAGEAMMAEAIPEEEEMMEEVYVIPEEVTISL